MIHSEEPARALSTPSEMASRQPYVSHTLGRETGRTSKWWAGHQISTRGPTLLLEHLPEDLPRRPPYQQHENTHTPRYPPLPAQHSTLQHSTGTDRRVDGPTPCPPRHDNYRRKSVREIDTRFRSRHRAATGTRHAGLPRASLPPQLSPHQGHLPHHRENARITATESIYPVSVALACTPRTVILRRFTTATGIGPKGQHTPSQRQPAETRRASTPSEVPSAHTASGPAAPPARPPLPPSALLT